MGAWPLTGRAEELSVLVGMLYGSDTNAGVVIAGRAGVGKTRLAREAMAEASKFGWDVRWVLGTAAAQSIPLAQVVETAYKRRIALFAHGYYRTPEIWFDPASATGRGRRRFRRLEPDVREVEEPLSPALRSTGGSDWVDQGVRPWPTRAARSSSRCSPS